MDTGLIQQGRNIVHTIGSAFKRKMKNIIGTKHVRFSRNTQVHIIPSCHEAAATVLVIATWEWTDITSPKLIKYKHNYQFYKKQAREW
jgi:hypothetical protein